MWVRLARSNTHTCREKLPSPFSSSLPFPPFPSLPLPPSILLPLSLQVYDQYLNFISLEDDFFILRNQMTRDISYYGNHSLPSLPPFLTHSIHSSLTPSLPLSLPPSIPPFLTHSIPGSSLTNSFE